MQENEARIHPRYRVETMKDVRPALTLHLGGGRTAAGTLVNLGASGLQFRVKAAEAGDVRLHQQYRFALEAPVFQADGLCLHLSAEGDDALIGLYVFNPSEQTDLAKLVEAATAAGSTAVPSGHAGQATPAATRALGETYRRLKGMALRLRLGLGGD